MPIKINCIHNDQGWWCKNKQIKRSLWNLGCRMCPVANGKECSLQVKYQRPPPPPMPPVPRYGISDIERAANTFREFGQSIGRMGYSMGYHVSPRPLPPQGSSGQSIAPDIAEGIAHKPRTRYENLEFEE